MTHELTFAAILTPAGRGALATIALQGPRAWEITQACLTEPVPLANAQTRPWLRRFRGTIEATEELVVTLPREQEARIHCHGGTAACEAVLQALEAQGATRTDHGSQKWPGRELLSQALTERTALILLDQLQGAFARELAAISQLIETRAVPDARQRIEALLSRAPFGLHLTEPWKVVIAGRPNAGKSSLLNALLGFQRSIISPLPGTTRDIVTARTAFDGWPIELRDTAGLRESSDSLEQAGVQLAQQEIKQADLVLQVIPADESVAEDDRELAASIPSRLGKQPLLIVRSKTDRGGAELVSKEEIGVSVVTGAGIDRLQSAIAAALVPCPPANSSAVPISSEQIRMLRELLDLVNE